MLPLDSESLSSIFAVQKEKDLRVVLYEFETLSFTLKEELKLRVFGEQGSIGPKREQMKGHWKKFALWGVS